MSKTVLPQYTSPRCVEADVSPDKTLQTHETRWNKMSELAGSHRQKDEVLKLARPMAPLAFRSGVPPNVIKRVRDLTITVLADDDVLLPEWLDVLANTCFALEHLTIERHYNNNNYIYNGNYNNNHHNNNNNNTKHYESAEAARMRRLYILYRLPDLTSIDGIPVTDVERQLARPNHPNGHKVNRHDWIRDDNDDSDEDASEDVCDRAQQDAVEVALNGTVKLIVPADAPERETCAEEQVFETRNSSRSTQQSPQTLQDSEEDASPRATALLTDAAGCLPKFQHSLCSRNEKYLPMDEDSSFQITNPFPRPSPRCNEYLNIQRRHWKEPCPATKSASEKPRIAGKRAAGLVEQPPTVKHSPRRIASTSFSSPRTPERPPLLPPKTTTPSSSTPTLLLSPTREAPRAAADHHQHLSPSLTSPFPMQFRNSSSRPPPVPGRRVTAPPPPADAHEQRRKRVVGRWRNRLQIRNKPILDDDDDDDDDSEGDDSDDMNE